MVLIINLLEFSKEYGKGSLSLYTRDNFMEDLK